VRPLAVLLLAVLACVAPRVVTVVTPYVSVLPLDSNNTQSLGQLRCDMANQPVIFVHPRLAPERQAWILTHERIHLEQSRIYGGCRSYYQRMGSDSLFRLAMEGEAFCQVAKAQQSVGAPVEPSYAEAYWLLRTSYYSSYDSVAVVKAMGCR
jgi:hypothetical protein